MRTRLQRRGAPPSSPAREPAVRPRELATAIGQEWDFPGWTRLPGRERRGDRRTSGPAVSDPTDLRRLWRWASRRRAYRPFHGRSQGGALTPWREVATGDGRPRAAAAPSRGRAGSVPVTEEPFPALSTATAVMAVPVRGLGSGRRGPGPGVVAATRTSRRRRRGRVAECG